MLLITKNVLGTSLEIKIAASSTGKAQQAKNAAMDEITRPNKLLKRL